MRKAIVTICIGAKYNKLAKLTHPTIKAYAEKIGADFIVIRDRKYPNKIPVGYEKLRYRNLLEKYDKLIHMDTDIIVRSDTPDLFKYTPDGIFCAFNEGEFIKERKAQLFDGEKAFGLSAPKFKDRYYNTGVMIFDKSHADIFEDPPEFVDHFYEQTYLNIMLARKVGIEKIRNLHHEFNRMYHLDMQKIKEHRLECYIVHYAGILQTENDFETVVKTDLDMWEIAKKDNYHIKRVVKVSCGGGLGDQIDAEPVVREIRRLYPLDKIIVATHWPEIFKDLPYNVEVVDIRKHFIPEEIYEVFHTYSPPEDDAWKYMTHIFAHSTDFSAQLAIRRVLPPEKKSIQIRYTPKDKLNMYAKLNILEGDLDGAICIHPGRSWRTKTMSSEFWTDLIKKCATLGRKLVVFGKDGKDLQGLTPCEIPEGVIDARDKLSIKESLALLDSSAVLVSNDSAPIHMAGATDIWITGIFTAKHTNFVLPFRHASQAYKTLELNLRPPCWPCTVDAVTTCINEVRADYCTNLDNLYCCKPTAESAFGKIAKLIELLNKDKTLKEFPKIELN